MVQLRLCERIISQLCLQKSFGSCLVTMRLIKKSLIICSCVLWTLSFLILKVWSNGGKDNISKSLESQGGNMRLLWSAGSFPFLCTALDGHMVRHELRKYEKNKETKQDRDNGTFTLLGSLGRTVICIYTYIYF